MAKRADIGSKRLASLDPEAWARWALENPRAEVRDLLATEFQWISRESDVLMRVYTPEQGEFLLLNEVQLRYDPRMPLRIQAYAALARSAIRVRSARFSP